MKRTFIIAEAGINHMGSLAEAKALVEAAKECGCDAVKFQSYRAEDRVDPSHGVFDLLKSCELNFEEQTELKCYADKIGIEFFSTPFSEEMLFFLIERLGLRRIKLASFDVTNRKFLNAVNQYATVLPTLKVIMSTGMANTKELYNAVELNLRNVKNLTLLHCISSYPTPETEVNLGVITKLKALAKTVGYSDHTDDILAPSLAVVAGAQVIEKHFTLDLDNGAVDNPVSADPEMMSQMVEVIRLHEVMLGNGLIGPKDIEEAAFAFRRRS